VTNRAREAWERWDAERAGAGHVPQLHENVRYRSFLRPTYLDYVSRVSWADHAVSLETAACLLQLCETFRPERVLDTGSGYSSYVLRRYAREHGATVVSVDTDVAWLGRTAEFLEDMGLEAEGLATWEDFRSTRPEPFGLVFHDIEGALRVPTMEQVVRLATPAGLVVFDDVHHPAVRREAHRVSDARGLRYVSMVAVTKDEIGRYSGLAF
jgi:predicted O-methyltransferase YrrM